MTWWVVPLCVLPVVALLLTLYNIVTWPRGRAVLVPSRTVSILVPARDEEANIESCVRGLLEDAPEQVVELLVYDDGSSDGTRKILDRLADEFERLRVLASVPLPDGWVGKPHACHRLALEAKGDLLWFADADTRAAKLAHARVGNLFTEFGADIVTAVPRQECVSVVERLIVPLLHFSYTCWLPLTLIHRTKDPRVLAANGQLLAVSREAYDAIGGFAAVKSEVVDDMAFCRRAKELGRKVLFADGYLISTCRMYRSGSEVVSGFSKNIYEGVGGTPMALLAAMALHLLAFIVPYAALAVGFFVGQPWLTVGLIGVGANVLLRIAGVVRFGHPVGGIVVHPIAVVGLLAIACNSWLWSKRGQVQWRGRAYLPRSKRQV